MPKITRIEIRDYRGIAELAIDVPPDGAVVSGGNARGKSSVLKAITAALAGQGIGPDAIRIGADQAEIMVNLDAIRVRRSITAKGGSLTVKNAEGDNWSKPQTRLNELFGTASLDALAFFLAEPKERRRMVLEALPVTVTAEDVARWAPGATKLLQRVSLEGHGLEVLERLHREVYDLRAEVNKAAKEARAKATAAANFPPGPDNAPTIEDAAEAHDAAEKALRQLQAREMAATEAKKGAEKTRALIEQAETRAKGYRAAAKDAPTDERIAEALGVHQRAADEVQRLEAALREARAAESKTRVAWEALCRTRDEAAAAQLDAEQEDRRVAELRATLADVDAMGVPAEQMRAAEDAVNAAGARWGLAKLALRAAESAAEHQRLAQMATKREADAAEIDAIVRRLATEAPQELAQRSALIPGLEVHGDTITLDGVSIEQLSGAEQMRFAVDLCKRLNANAGILIVDGLERLDANALETFVEAATAGGTQLIGTRVSRGELVIEALAPGKEASHAA